MFIISAVILLLLVAGCSQQAVETTPEITTPQSESQPEGAYPAPGDSNTGYPAPATIVADESSNQNVEEIPVTAGTASIYGKLLVLDPDQAFPDPNDGIFLVPLPQTDSVTMIPTFQVGQVPQAQVDESSGEFLFTDIPPGQYIIMILTVHNTQIPARTETGQMAIIQVDETNLDTAIEVEYLQVP